MSTPMTILLVDDDPDCRMLIRDAIESSKFSHTVYEVSDGKEALHFLRQAGEFSAAPRPELIYLDIEMPGMNGLEALKAIKANPQLGAMIVEDLERRRDFAKETDLREYMELAIGDVMEASVAARAK